MKTFVYLVALQTTGLSYVGIAAQPKRRWAQHRSDARAGSATRFHRAIAKHGPEAFDWRILGRCESRAGAVAWERILIAAGFGPYNLTSGGDGSEGWRHGPGARQKMRAAKLGRPNAAVSASNRRRMGPRKAVCKSGHALNPETRYPTTGKCILCARQKAKARKTRLRAGSS